MQGSGLVPPTNGPPATGNQPLYQGQTSAAGNIGVQAMTQPLATQPPLASQTPASHGPSQTTVPGRPVVGTAGMRPQPSSMRPIPSAAPIRPVPHTNGVAAPGSTGAMGPMDAAARQQWQPQSAPSSSGSKLNTDMMPRPCAVERECGLPREYYSRSQSSGGAAGVPGANSDYISVDDGSARLRYMRLTTNAIAADPAVMSRSGVPLAVILTPFADPVQGEAGIPVVDLTANAGGGPLRCERCRGYANPGFKFLNGGSQFQCNICTHTNQTPPEQYSPIAPTSGLRMDVDTRHEFRFGSVEYIVGSSDYWVRKPAPACFVFAFDISAPAIKSGLAASSIASVRAALGAGMLRGADAGARVGILTYDRLLHYYDARGSEEGKSVVLHVVPDVDDPFVPIGGDAFFMTVAQAVAALEFITEVHGLVPSATAAQGAQQGQEFAKPSESALGAALEGIKLALSSCGGKAFIVAGSIPSVGPGKLERRGGAVSGGEEREMGLLKAAVPSYEVLGCELAEAQISVDLFLAPSSAYVEAATLIRVPRSCGGRTYIFPTFDALRDGACLHRSLCSAIGSVCAFEALLRVRTSVGIETTGEYVGHFGRPQRGEDVSGPVFDSTSALALEMSVVSKLSGADSMKPAAGMLNGSFASGGISSAVGLYDDACIQAAILFTDPAGKRRIRVHTVFANKTTVLADLFKGSDADATLTFFAKKAATAVLASGTLLSKAREALIDKTTQALFVYRKHCTSTSMSGQLILPDSLKVLPSMILGLTKSKAFRPASHLPQSSDAITVDERVAALSFLTWASPADIVVLSYPRMWSLHKLPDKAGLPMPLPSSPVVGDNVLSGAHVVKPDASAEPFAMPNSVALSSAAFENEGVYLIENGMQLVVWMGSAADAALANDVIAQVAGGRLVIRAETAGSVELLKSASDRARRIAAIVQRITAQRSVLSQPQVVLRQAPGTGLEARHVLPLMVEDKPIRGGFSYVEFLRNVHKRIMDKIANDSAQSEMHTWEMLNHGY